MFVKNDVNLSADERIWILTGPNMGGKSTFLRQCALLSILAQAGSFVPADAATLGIVDAVFSRIGASDDLSANESTFMIEMRETAEILEQATRHSLVVMDEVGRGTSMRDGLALAYGIVKHLVQVNGCRGLFATHYHELAVEGKMPGIGCYQAAVARDQASSFSLGPLRGMIIVDGNLMCLYHIEPGVMESSHGIEIASIAGLPDSVIDVAKNKSREFKL
eukprot:jgi/Hompol1/501/HPOL_002536-RA